MAKKAKCTKCGSTDLTFCEDTTSYRRVLGFDKHGVLVISDQENLSDGDNERLECNKCGAEIPLSNFEEIDYRCQL